MRYSSGNFFGYALFTFALHLDVDAESGVACKDQQGSSFESGFHYVPGPEPCTFCVCDNGNPKWCKAFICKFPQEDCKSFRRGETCCEFICLDDTLSSMANDKADGSTGGAVDGAINYDQGMRSVISFIMAVLTLSIVFFLVHCLRQRMIRVCMAGRQSGELTEDQRNLGNMGYIEREGLSHGVPMDDVPCGANYPLWKPPGNYFPRGEAPPPYEEAVAAARAEQALLSMNPHSLPTLNFSNGYLPASSNRTSVAVVESGRGAMDGAPASQLCNNESSSTTATNANANANTNVIINATANASASPLLATPSRPHSGSSTYANYHPPSHEEMTTQGLAGMGQSTGTFAMSSTTYENLPTPISVPDFGTRSLVGNGTTGAGGAHSNLPKGYQHHTTLPRQSGAFTISANLCNSTIAAHRTIPRNLTMRNVTKLKEVRPDRSTKDHSPHFSAQESTRTGPAPGSVPLPLPLALPLPLPLPLPLSLPQPQSQSQSQSLPLPSLPLSLPVPQPTPSPSPAATPVPAPAPAPAPAPTPAFAKADRSSKDEYTTRSDAFYKDPLMTATLAVPLQEDDSHRSTGNPGAVHSFKPILKLANELNENGSFESVTCSCSMQALPTLHDDADDYRSECENCKSATGSRYYLDNEDELVTSPHETMTLHRRPDEGASSSTPQYYRTSLTLPTSTRQRTRSTGIRENWFSTMPQSSTESSDEN